MLLFQNAFLAEISYCYYLKTFWTATAVYWKFIIYTRTRYGAMTMIVLDEYASAILQANARLVFV